MHRRADAWENGYFRKIDDQLVYTTPNQYPPQMDIKIRTQVRNYLAIKLTFPGQKRLKPIFPLCYSFENYMGSAYELALQTLSYRDNVSTI